MNTAEQYFEQIERYLQGKLPEADARALEAYMDTDPEFAALVQQHRLERQGLELLVERDLLGKMHSGTGRRRFSSKQPSRAAGSCAPCAG